MPPPLPADVAAKRPFRLSAISVLILLGAIAFRVWVFFKFNDTPLTAATSGQFSQLCGNIVGVLLLSGLFAWIAWLMFRRSTVVGNIVFCLAVIGFSGMTWQAAQNRHAMEAVNKVERDMAGNLRETLKNAKGDPSSALAQFNKLSDTLGQASSQMSGRDKRAAEAGQHFTKMLSAKVQLYSDAYKPLSKAGFAQAKGIASKDDIGHRRGLVNAFGDANKQVTDFYKASERTFRTELEKENLDGPYIDQVLRGFRESASVDIVLRVRKCDEELVAQMNKLLDIYEREWGAWRVDDAGKVIFVNPDAVKEFNGAQKSIVEIAERQKAAQEEIIKKAEARKSEPN